MKLHLGTKAFKIHVNDQAFKMHIGNDLPVVPQACNLLISWQTGVKEVIVTRNGKVLTSNDLIYTGDQLYVEAVAVDGIQLNPHITSYIVDSDIHIHIDPETPVMADTEQTLYLANDIQLNVFLENEDYWFSSDFIGLKTICSQCNWGTNAIRKGYPNKLNPIHVYNIETDDGGYILDEAYLALESPEAEAAYIQTHGTYLGSLWVENNCWYVTYKQPEQHRIATYYDMQSNQVIMLPTGYPMSITFEEWDDCMAYYFSSDFTIELIRKGQNPIDIAYNGLEHWSSGRIAEELTTPGDIIEFYLFDVCQYDDNYDNGFAAIMGQTDIEAEFIKNNGLYLGCAIVDDNSRWRVVFNHA